jgi:hypothetical protein
MDTHDTHNAHDAHDAHNPHDTRPNMHAFSRRALLATIGAVLIAAPIVVAAVAPPPVLTVTVRDNIIRGDTENIVFSGTITITGKLIDDPQFRAPPVLQLVIDFSKLTGTGLASGRKYVTNAEAVVQRPVLNFDPVQASFPYYPENDLLAARTALASFAVSFRPPAGIAVSSKLSAP